MQLGDLRWIDVERLDKSRAVVICPLASLEQHGHHLPLLTDTYLASEVARRVHEQLNEQTVLVPTLWLGASDHHLDFPGTISVPNTVYIEMIKAMTRSLIQAGFCRIFFLNGHGGNVAPGETAITEMANEDERCDQAFIALGSYWALASAAMAAERHGMQTPQLTHACEYETSMMLCVQGELVHLSEARGAQSTGAPSPSGVRVAGRFHRMSETGALGGPEFATAEKGASLLEAISAEVAAFVEQLSKWPLRKVIKDRMVSNEEKQK